jgi:hypothetical protein
MVESLAPATVCLADGELRVNLERALDRPPSPLTVPAVVQPVVEADIQESMFDMPLPITAGFVPFAGRGNRLGGV